MKLSDLAVLVGGRAFGDPDAEILRVCALDQPFADGIAFWERGELPPHLPGAVLSKTEFPGTGIVVRHPRAALARCWPKLHPDPPVIAGIHLTAWVDPEASVDGAWIGPMAVVEAGAHIGRGSSIGAHTVVGKQAKVGQDCRIESHVTLAAQVRIGDRVAIGPGAVIGHEGFGVAEEDGELFPMPHLGDVVIEDDVRIGVNTCIDRASFGSTRIGRGTQIDNLVQVAHNVQIGQNVRLAAFAGVSGGAHLEEGVLLGGRASVVEGIRVGAGAILLALSAATRAVRAGEVIGGAPGRPRAEWLRDLATLRHLARSGGTGGSHRD